MALRPPIEHQAVLDVLRASEETTLHGTLYDLARSAALSKAVEELRVEVKRSVAQ